MATRRGIALAAGAAAMVLMTACSSGGGGQASGDSGASGGGATGEFEGRGPITYVQGKDNSGLMAPMLDDWNKDHPDEKVEMIELSAEADQQRNSMVQNAQTQSDAYCVISLDNIHVAEFAAHRWVEPLNEADFPKDKILPAVWQTGLYRDQLYAMPHGSDGGILYYRKDLLEQAGVTDPPKTWDDMKKGCEAVRGLDGHSDIGCYGGQMAKYEGLTVNVDEAIHSAGGQIISPEGEVVVDSPEALKGLQTLEDAFKDNFIPEEALTYKEEEGRAAFEADRLVYYRNWPYQYSLTKEKLGDKFGVAPLPGFTADQPEGGVSSLGGHNVAISSFCKNKATAYDFIKWFTSEEIGKRMLTEQTLAPIYSALYEDPELIDQYPYLPALKGSIESAAPRPQVVNYGDVSAAIQDAVFPVLQRQATPEQALKDLSAKLTELTAGQQ